MFSIENGKVVAKFSESDKVELSLEDVKIDLKMLALTALQRVSRETVAGLATEKPAEAKQKLLARWELWKQGKWETVRAPAAKLTEQEIEEIAFAVFEFFCKAAGKAGYYQQARDLIAKKDKAAVARWQKFKTDHSKAIKKRITETLKIRKQGVEQY